MRQVTTIPKSGKRTSDLQDKRRKEIIAFIESCYKYAIVEHYGKGNSQSEFASYRECVKTLKLENQVKVYRRGENTFLERLT